MTAQLANPLLSNSEFVKYQNIKPEHIYPATIEITKLAQAKLEEILSYQGELSFDTVMYPLIDLEDMVDKVWTPVENILPCKKYQLSLLILYRLSDKHLHLHAKSQYHLLF